MKAPLAKSPLDSTQNSIAAPGGIDSDCLAQVLRHQGELRSTLETTQRRLAVLNDELPQAHLSEAIIVQLRSELHALRAKLSQGRALAQRPDDVGLEDTVEGEEGGLLPTIADDADISANGVDSAQDDSVLVELLSQETNQQKEEIRRLRSEADDWFAQATDLDAKLREEHRQLQELEELAEASMAEAERLRKELHAAHAALADAQMAGQIRPAETVAESTTSEVILATLREIAATVRRAADPSPAILSGLRDVRTTLGELAEGQHELAQLVERRVAAAQVPATTSDDIIIEAVVRQSEHTASAVDPLLVIDAPANVEESTVLPIVEPQEVDWEDYYPTIEHAALDGLNVGDSHQRQHFLAIIDRLQRTSVGYQDRETLLAALTAVQQRYGDGFEYCLLDSALKLMHKPSLNPALVVIKMAEAKRRRGRKHH